MMEMGRSKLQDIGFVTFFEKGQEQTRYFANVAGMAYDAFVVAYAEKNKKWVTNTLMYLFLTLNCLFRYKLVKSKIIFDNRLEEGYFNTINAGICKYSGGGMQLVPHAVPDDGLLALTFARNVSKLEILLNTYRSYPVWSDFWEETTELIFVAAIGLLLWFYRNQLKLVRKPQSDQHHEN